MKKEEVFDNSNKDSKKRLDSIEQDFGNPPNTQVRRKIFFTNDENTYSRTRINKGSLSYNKPLQNVEDGTSFSNFYPVNANSISLLRNENKITSSGNRNNEVDLTNADKNFRSINKSNEVNSNNTDSMFHSVNLNNELKLVNTEEIFRSVNMSNERGSVYGYNNIGFSNMNNDLNATNTNRNIRANNNNYYDQNADSTKDGIQSNREIKESLMELINTAKNNANNFSKLAQNNLMGGVNSIKNITIDEIQEESFKAIDSGNIAMLNILIKKGGNINRLNNNGDTLLSYASKKNNYAAVKTLLNYSTGLQNLNVSLSYAKANKNNFISNMLLEKIGTIKNNRVQVNPTKWYQQKENCIIEM